MGDALGALRAVLVPVFAVLGIAIVLVLLIGGFLGGLGFAIGTIADVMSTPGTGEAPTGGAYEPEANFTVTADAERGTATIEHVNGDPIDVHALVLYVNEEARGGWADFDQNVSRVAEGDSVTLEDVRGGDEVTISYERGDDERDLHRELV